MTTEQWLAEFRRLCRLHLLLDADMDFDWVVERAHDFAIEEPIETLRWLREKLNLEWFEADEFLIAQQPPRSKT